MLKNNTIAGVILALLLLFFVAGVTHLFLLRFESGDVYPAYSSLRSDPLGTGALFESLKNLDGVAVQRNYQPLKAITLEPQTTLFYLGASAASFEPASENMQAVFDRLFQSGGRLVLTFLPVTKKYEPKADRDLPKKKESTGSRSRYTHWGIGLAYKETLPIIDDKHQPIEAASSRKGLPPAISWHTNLYFELFDPSWETLYSHNGRALIVERDYGQGSIVMCADSFFVSNEALRSERHPGLLVWLVGGNSRMLFDEAHLGIYKQPSVAQLIRRHRFHWFFAVLAILAILFVWKSAAYFVPPSDNEAPESTQVLSAKDYLQGLVALLRRHIPEHHILPVCAREWEATLKKVKNPRPALLETISRLAGRKPSGSKKRRDPVAEYRAISKMMD